MCNCYRSENPQPCPKCEGSESQPDSECSGCKMPAWDDELNLSVDGDRYCDGCFDQLPQLCCFCGHEASGIDLDMGICPECKEHTTWER
jgi:hypothetical protein